MGGTSPAEQDLEKITWVKEASAYLKPFMAGNYINRESLFHASTVEEGAPLTLISLPLPCLLQS